MGGARTGGCQSDGRGGNGYGDSFARRWRGVGTRPKRGGETDTARQLRARTRLRGGIVRFGGIRRACCLPSARRRRRHRRCRCRRCRCATSSVVRRSRQTLIRGDTAINYDHAVAAVRPPGSFANRTVPGDSIAISLSLYYIGIIITCFFYALLSLRLNFRKHRRRCRDIRTARHESPLAGPTATTAVAVTGTAVNGGAVEVVSNGTSWL